MDERERGMQLLDDAATGCTLTFIPTGKAYQPLSALAVLAGLNGKKFSGICECYIRPGVRDGAYLMGIGLESTGEEPPEEWWGELVGNIGCACADDPEVRLERDGCEFATVGELRAAMVHAGTAGFESGLAVWVSDPVGPDPKSPFTVVCRCAR
jgi:hypothetical protein